MKITVKSDNTKRIEVGDIVTYDDEMGIVAYEKEVYINPINGKDEAELEFPYMIISLTTGQVLNAYGSLECMEEDVYNVKFIAKNKDVELII